MDSIHIITYTLKGYGGEHKGILEGVIVVGILLTISIIYLLIIKNEKKIFKNTKEIFIFIIIVSFIFMLILPFFSSDIYYYIGDSWINSKYGENPYYISVKDLQNTGVDDEILRNTGYWSDTTSVYGPMWNSIAKIMSMMSFGNITIALFIFKFVAYLIHALNCYLIYKITKSSKYILLYGLNPLVLIELLSNVHNDIYLITFVLLALYFLINKKNTIFTMLFLALSIAIKYSTVILVPFILIYIYKDKKIPKRILYSFISGIGIIAVVVLLYMPYYRDITIFTNMLVQDSKYSQSIILLLMQILNQKPFSLIDSLRIPMFAIIYMTEVFLLLFKRNISIHEIFTKYNIVMIICIFFALTNFQKWYILWLFPTILLDDNKYLKTFVLSLTLTAIIPSFSYFKIGCDAFKVGMYYSLIMLIISCLIMCIIKGIEIVKNKKKLVKEN